MISQLSTPVLQDIDGRKCVVFCVNRVFWALATAASRLLCTATSLDHTCKRSLLKVTITYLGNDIFKIIAISTLIFAQHFLDTATEMAYLAADLLQRSG